MMTARIYSYGNSDQIKIENSPGPKVKANEVLVKIHAAGVNPVDWKIREGYMKSAKPQFPLILGQDFAGEVVELGSGVSNFKIGGKVFGLASGSYAEFASVPQDKIAAMPQSMDFETAASIPTPGLTAWESIEKAQLKAGQTVLIHGAAGGVGTFAVQIAVWKKARVFATASASDASFLQKLGVEKIIDYKTQRFEEVVKDVDVVLDLVGGNTLSRSYQIMKRNGTALSIVGGFNESEASSFGIRGENFMMRFNAQSLSEIANLIDQGTLKIRVGKVLPLAQAKLAQELNQKGHTHGKIILKVM